ncbi:30S ribosomal protein S5 [Candidatus Woesearchaeota archaeon]|nr:30S ribosomal protein S5 [Candidatus Woesearchaeota archaeon]
MKKQIELKTEEVPEGIRREKAFNPDAWKPKTDLGRQVKEGKVASLNEILDSGKRILEAEIADYLVHDLQSEVLSVGQSKGKFGGGKRSIWKSTQKKTSEGNKPKFATLIIVGNKNGFLGMGYGKSKETMPAKEKALRKAKLNIVQIKRSQTSKTGNTFTIPAKVTGKYGSSTMTLMPAPQGTGLCIENECKKVLAMAGVTDVYSRATNSKTKYNSINACFNALKEISKLKIKPEFVKKANIISGPKNE